MDDLRQMEEFSLQHDADWDDVSMIHSCVALHMSSQDRESDIFDQFKSHVRKMDEKLLDLTRAVPQLGGSVRIIIIAESLRKFLPHLLHISWDNAHHLFPQRIKPPPEYNRERRSRRRAELAVTDDLQVTSNRYQNVEDLPNVLKTLSEDLTTFKDCLLDFQALTEDGCDALETFICYLIYWSKCLGRYRDRFHEVAFQRYIHRITMEMNDKLPFIVAELEYVCKTAMPANIAENVRSTSVMLQFSASAVFLSGVTATTLQFSYSADHTFLFILVNILWFTSLALSTVSAVISLIGVSWLVSKYRSSGTKMPSWILISMVHSPMLFLDIAIFAFLAGLLVFPYASSQHLATSLVTTISICLGALVIMASANWFLFEWVTYLRHHGFKAPLDLLSEFWERLQARHRAFKWLNILHRQNFWLPVFAKPSSKLPTDEDEDGLLLAARYSRNEQARKTRMARPTINALPSDRAIGQLLALVHTVSTSVESGCGGPSSALGDTASLVSDPGTATSEQDTSYRLQWLSPSEWASQSGSPSSIAVDQPGPARHQSSTLLRKEYQLQTATSVKHLHLDFSPDGTRLAASRWNEETVIFDFEAVVPSERHHLAKHRGLLGLVAWSPKGDLLLTSSSRSIEVWTAEGDLKATVRRTKHVESIAWLSDGKTFFSVEGSGIVMMNDAGQVLRTIQLPHMQIYGASVTPGGHRLVCVGTSVGDHDVHQRHMSGLEKRIIVCDLRTNEIEDQVPVWDDVRFIVMSRSGRTILLGFKHGAPPQLWALSDSAHLASSECPYELQASGGVTTFKERLHPTPCLSLARTYDDAHVSKKGFSKRCYFGGPRDEFVVCKTRAGGLCVWDTKTGNLLHRLSPDSINGDVSCMAWNDASAEDIMFATGNSRGAITIWRTAPAPSKNTTMPVAKPTSSESASVGAPPVPMPSPQRLRRRRRSQNGTSSTHSAPSTASLGYSNPSQGA